MKTKQTKRTADQGQEVERLLDAIESAPPEKRSLMALLAETYINGMKAQDKLVAVSRTTASG